MGVAFRLGIALQFDWIYPEYKQGAWGQLLGNGMTDLALEVRWEGGGKG